MTLRTTERDEIILNPISDKGFIPPIFEDLSKLKKQFNFFCLVFYFFGCTARHVELSGPGNEPSPPAVQVQSLNP